VTDRLSRRRFLAGGATGLGVATFAPGAFHAVYAGTAQPGAGPYGQLQPDPETGLLLPAGFTARTIARSGDLVGPSDYSWHNAPDAGATFPTDAGGWIYVSNAEVQNTGGGGAGAVEFDADGEIVGAHTILDGTRSNCAGGPTPWGTWLSCEEYDFSEFPDLAAPEPAAAGQVWECDPTGATEATALPALGLFNHEAVAIDPDLEVAYLTEDKGDGLLYRFRPDAYPDLTAGALEVAVVGESGAVEWLPLPDPSAASMPTRLQVPEATTFKGGEGIWFHEGVVYFTTKGDDRVHALETASDTYELVYDAEALGAEAPLRGVDNITVEPGSGDLFVAEDGGSMQVVLITPDGEVAPFIHIPGHEISEVTGPAFDPSGTRLYFSSQRGLGEADAFRGVTYEVTGPFRGAAAEADETSTTTVPTPGSTLEAATPAVDDSSDDGGGTSPVPFVVGGLALGALAGGALAVRRRGNAT
jgi:secreted PhoX family phosphatase